MTKPSKPVADRTASPGHQRLSLVVLGFAALVSLGWAAMHFGDIKTFAVTLKRSNPFWLFAALALQASTYWCVAQGWRQVLAKAGAPQSLTRLMPIAVSKLFADQALPTAGMGGNVLLVGRLRTLGVPRNIAVATLLVSMIGYYAVYAILALAMLVLLWFHGRATPLLAGMVTAFLLLALAIPSLALWLRRRGSKPLSPFLEAIPVVRSLLHVVGKAPKALMTDRLLLAKVAAFNGLIFLADATTLAVCLRALGAPVSFETSYIAVMTASIVVTLGPIPLGLGVYEAGSTAMLTMLGVPLATALAGTLLLRGFTLWLPLIPGFLLLRSSLRQARKRPAKHEVTSKFLPNREKANLQ
jgi:glycosyltransferase 2 family protein